MAMFTIVFVGVIVPVFFFSSDGAATTEIYTLSLHDALPISERLAPLIACIVPWLMTGLPLILRLRLAVSALMRSEEHTSELQSHVKIVCRFLLDKKMPLPMVSTVAVAWLPPPNA